MQTGDVLRGKYRLVRLLGDGGMGSVYEAHHEGLGTRVAIKVLHTDLARRPGLIERFLREARVSAQIKSPNVVHVLDVERTDEGIAYIVMELLEGEPLSAVLERDGKIEIHTACEYAVQILRALEAAHVLGIIHRDLKPENVFVMATQGAPHLKLIDFGIAKARQTDSQAKNLTVAGIVMGTPEYMAPEQAHAADKVDARSDLFAVGVMLYEMICGSRPVTGDDARLVAMRVERGDVRPLVHAAPGVPPDLAGLVHRAMAPRPELRFGSAVDMRAALEAVLAGKRLSTVGAVVAGLPAPGSTAAPITDRVSVISPHEAAADPVGTGGDTVLTDPTGEALRRGAPSHPGTQGSTYARESQWGGVSPPQSRVSRAGSPAYAPPGPAARGRSQRRKSSSWFLFAIPLLLGAGIVVVFAMSSGSGPALQSPSKLPSPPLVNIAPTPTPSPSLPPPTEDPSTVPPLSPLNGPQAGPTPSRPPQPASNPSPSGSKPHPSASASPTPPPVDSTSTFPFPSGFPSIPNPFPSPSSSGVGPVITIPTSFPTFPFPFPGAPAPTSSSPAPAPSGKSI
jgi:eukaryotic-like serine/threonine-protein kinase